MTDKIKVWVGANSKGQPAVFVADGIGDEKAWLLLRWCMTFDRKPSDFEKEGWTIQPYTLVKGHGETE